MGFAVFVRRVTALAAAGFLCTIASNAQTDRGSEVGAPLIEYFDTGNIGSLQSQIMSVGMDARGLMYFGNQAGLVEYDGTSWRVIQLPLEAPVFSMDRGIDGRLYLGGFGYFGCLDTDAQGKLAVRVLSDSLAPDMRDFSRVDETHVLGDTVWYRSSEGLYYWDGSRAGVIRSDGAIRRSFAVNGRIHAVIQGKGLCVVSGAAFHLLPGGEQFSDPEENLVFMRALDERRMLVGLRVGGVQVFDGRMWMPAWDFPSKFPARVSVGGGISLADGTFALYTGKHGVWITDTQGDVRIVIDKAVGLGDDSPTNLFADDAQNLWVALDKGIARVEWPAPITHFGPESGLEGQVTDVERFDGGLFVTTTYGLYRLVRGDPRAGESSDIRARFVEVEGTDMECFDLCPTRHGLLVANPAAGILSYGHDGVLRKVSTVRGELLEKVDSEGDTVFVASPDAFALLVYSGRSWELVEQHSFKHENKFHRMMREPDKTFWVTTVRSTVYRIDLSSGVIDGNVRRYDTLDGLPDGAIMLGRAGGIGRFFTSDEEMVLFDKRNNRFVPDTTYLDLFDNDRVETPVVLHTDRFGRIWSQDAYWTVSLAVPRSDGRFDVQTAAFARISAYDLAHIYVDADSVAWFGCDNELLRYDPRVRKSYRLPFRTLIRAVRTDDRVWYHGDTDPGLLPPPAFPYGHLPITFSFASTYHAAPNTNYYYYRVPERDTTWVGPSSITEVVLRNFGEGEYRFEVFAMNAEGAISDVATYHFSVLPPWYRTWWAYVLYFLALGVFVLTGRLWYRTRYLRRRGEELEQTVRERTAELEHKSREILRQAEELERLDTIVRTVNRETKLPNVLDALLLQSLLFFPNADTALFVRRNPESNLFRVETVTGRFAEDLQDREFSLRELLGSVDVSMERMREGVYVLSGLGERIAARTGDASASDTRFMAMSVQRGRVIEGFLVLGSGDSESFGPADLQRLLRLKEHASSAVAKAGAIAELEKKNAALDSTNHQLLATQEQLVAQKKIAALGELTAGIAHEIQNPLNFVNNFSELSCELLDELQQGLQGIEGPQMESLRRTMELVKANCEHIRQHGRRATSIVSAMVMHSRGGTSTRDNVQLNDLVDEFVMLAYHGMRLQFPQFQLDLQRKYDDNVGKVPVLPQDLSRAIVNICNNAWEAAILKAAEDGPGAVPTVLVRSQRVNDSVHVLIRDNGAGIGEDLADRIFEPFFTTKRDSRNAGLGLSMSHEIITQLHRGELKVRSEAGKFTEFEIRLPAGGD